MVTQTALVLVDPLLSADLDNPERPIQDPNNAAAEEIKEGSYRRPQTVEDVAAGGAGGGGHRLKIRPRGLLDEAVFDADIGSRLGRVTRIGIGGVDRGRRQKVPERGVAQGRGLNG